MYTSLPTEGTDLARADDNNRNNAYDYLFKIILLGPSGAGKSSLLRRFVTSSFPVLTSQTIGVEFASKILTLDPSSSTSSSSFPASASSRSRIKLQLWDTAGTERFRSVSRAYYLAAAGALLVYDLLDDDIASTLAALDTFLADIRALAGPGCVVVLVGNKHDHGEQLNARDNGGTQGADAIADQNARIRDAEHQARDWAQRNAIWTTSTTSALSGLNVDAVFRRLAGAVLARIELAEVNPDDPLSGIQYGDHHRFGGGGGGGGKEAGSVDSYGPRDDDRRGSRPVTGPVSSRLASARGLREIDVEDPQSLSVGWMARVGRCC